MNEQYVKHLMENNKDENPIKLWAQFVGFQLLGGAALVVALLIVFGIIEIIKGL